MDQAYQRIPPVHQAHQKAPQWIKHIKEKNLVDQAHQEPFLVVQAPQEPSPSELSMSNIILSKKVEDFSSTFQASQAEYP